MGDLTTIVSAMGGNQPFLGLDDLLESSGRFQTPDNDIGLLGFDGQLLTGFDGQILTGAAA